MPKEPKHVVCCGELQTAPNVHRLAVHQQWSRIRFDNHPSANFTLRRDPTDQQFHCPECDMRSSIATPVRQHILHQCVGYAEHRVVIPKIRIKPISQGGVSSDNSNSGIAATGAEAVSVGVGELAVKTEVVEPEGHGTAQVQQIVEENPVENETVAASVPGTPISSIDSAPSTQSLVYPHSGPFYTSQLDADATPEPMSIPSSDDPNATPAQLERLPPMLRPAVWQPINNLSTSSRRPDSLPTSTPPLTRSDSSPSSMASLRTVSHGSISGSFRFPIKTEFDYNRNTTSTPKSSLLPLTLPLVVPTQQRSSPSSSSTNPATAARFFLEGLRRPLAYATPHLHALGVVSEADLDLVCTMPGTWEELGDLLRRNGVTMIEWLMIKEAFKARASRVPAVA